MDQSVERAISRIVSWTMVAAAGSASVVWYPESVVIVLVVLGLVQIGWWMQPYIDSGEGWTRRLPLIAAWIILATWLTKGWGDVWPSLLGTIPFGLFVLFPLAIGMALRERSGERITVLERRLREAGDCRSESEEGLARRLREIGMEDGALFEGHDRSR